MLVEAVGACSSTSIHGITYEASLRGKLRWMMVQYLSWPIDTTTNKITLIPQLIKLTAIIKLDCMHQDIITAESCDHLLFRVWGACSKITTVMSHWSRREAPMLPGNKQPLGMMIQCKAYPARYQVHCKNGSAPGTHLKRKLTGLDPTGPLIYEPFYTRALGFPPESLPQRPQVLNLFIVLPTLHSLVTLSAFVWNPFIDNWLVGDLGFLSSMGACFLGSVQGIWYWYHPRGLVTEAYNEGWRDCLMFGFASGVWGSLSITVGSGTTGVHFSRSESPLLVSGVVMTNIESSILQCNRCTRSYCKMHLVFYKSEFILQSWDL